MIARAFGYADRSFIIVSYSGAVRCRLSPGPWPVRTETERIIAFRSHWGYHTEYCNPAKGNEKGSVEGELGWYQRNCLVPFPEAKDLATLILRKQRAES